MEVLICSGDRDTLQLVNDQVTVLYPVKGVSEGVATIELMYGEREVATKKESFSLSADEMRAGKTFATVMRFVPTKTDADSKKQEYSVKVKVTFTPTGGKSASKTARVRFRRG